MTVRRQPGARHLRAFVAAVLTLAAVGGSLVANTPAAAARLPVANALAVTGIFPVFDKPRSTADGFTVNVINYSTEYAWSVSIDAGHVRTGTASGTTWPLTVTGLQPGQSATVQVTAEMPGLDPSRATVTGTALPATGGHSVKGSATEHLSFPGSTTRLDPEGTLMLQRLVARIPTDATPMRVMITVAAPRQASATQIRLARSRASVITKYLLSRGVTPTPSVSIAQGARRGTATVTVDYLH
jgi:outer membrane protein OmpA-like peptidoglycan-associated protein